MALAVESVRLMQRSVTAYLTETHAVRVVVRT
jgi:hypothetical protein